MGQSRIAVLARMLSLVVAGGAPSVELDYFPTNGWRASTAEEQGMDTAVLDGLDREFANGEHGYVDGMLVTRNGYIVYEKSYRHNYDAINASAERRYADYYYDAKMYPFHAGGPLHALQSVTKSVSSMIIGIAIERNEFPGIGEKLVGQFADREIALHDDMKKSITIENVLTMRAGFEWDEYRHGTEMEESDDWSSYVLDKPMAFAPGTRFHYCSGASQLLSVVFEKSTGKRIDEYAEEHLFSPLGIENYHWVKSPKGVPHTGRGLFMTPRDLAKVGLLLMNEGRWSGQQIVPEKWVRASTELRVSETDVPGRGYGYQWWLIPHGGRSRAYAIVGLGRGGQRLFILPEYGLVAAFTGWNIYDKKALPVGVLQRYVLAAIGS